MTLNAYLIAGEASGDLLGAGLMEALKRATGGNVTFHGIGGDRMAGQGLATLFPHHDLSLIGFTEVLPHAITILSRVNQAVEDILLKRPDVVITIDVPGFTLRVVEKLRRMKVTGIKFVHYVAPTVWAYRPERAAHCKELFDHMLVLLPFEPPYFEKVGLPVTFVGHPVACLEKGDGAAFRAEAKLAPGQKLICLMPGSRASEIRRHMPVMARTVAMLAESQPDIAMVVPVARRFIPMMAVYFEDCPYRAILMADDADKRHAIAASDVALVKSGTVSLEVARMGTPQVVTYRANPITVAILRRIMQQRYVNLINIMAGREVIPELLQQQCRPDFLAVALEALLSQPELGMRQREEAEAILARMLPPGGRAPGDIAAEVILRVISA